MNILIINDYASVQGGAAQVAITSAKALADSGHNVIYIFATGNSDPLLNHPRIKLINFKQYDLLSNPNKLDSMIKGIWNRSVKKQMNAVLDSLNSKNTIIHVHSWVKALSPSILSALVKREIPVVVTLHDYFTVCPNGGLFNYQEKTICHLTPMSMECLLSNCDKRSYVQKIWRFLRQFIYIKANIPKNLTHYIFVSQFSKQILQPYLPKDSNFYHVPNPIDIQKTDISNPEDSNIFSYVGRLSEEKGPLLFAEAGATLQLPTQFIGTGELQEEIQTIYEDAKFTGWADRTEVIKYIQNSRAIVFPSLLYETQGMVVAEAAALGIPAIVADTSAASEYVTNGETGLLFESGNVESLMEKINILSQQPLLAKEMGINAYNTYWNDPDNTQKHLKKLIQCYQEILTC